MTQLEEIADFEAKVPSKWEKPGYLFDMEIKRLRFDFAAARIVPSIPRRLGIYASRLQLSADEKLGRKMANVALRGLQWRGADEKWMHDWVKAALTARKNDKAYKEAAQRKWTEWYYDRITWIEQHRPVVACWGIQSGRRRDANMLCSHLAGEQKMMEEVWQKVAPNEWREPDDRSPDAQEPAQEEV